uniref:Tc1-like transposase DDE domain-containing protein n=1 Tax=Lates calcarifer TaxID=8187 RepID=A0A4W6CMA3_LATCA
MLPIKAWILILCTIGSTQSVWMEWPTSSPDLNPTAHVWDQLGRVNSVCARVTNTTMLADLRLLVEEWDAIPQQCVTRLVTSMRRRCQALVAVYGSSTRY